MPIPTLLILTLALAQPAPAPAPAQPVPTPAQPAPAPAQPAPAQPAQTPGTAMPIGQPAAPAQPTPPIQPNKWEIAADAKPLSRAELEGGIIVEDFVAGTGDPLVADGVAVAHYHGMLREGGTVFQSSFVTGQPMTFALNQMIPAWQKAMPGMKTGGLRRLTIPAALAYGAEGRPPAIPPNADLVFVIELLATLGVEDTKVGEGDVVSKAAVCVVAHTVKGADGAVLESSTREAPYIVIPGESAGFSGGLTGMKVGGKRTIRIPKELNQNAALPDIRRPSGVPITMEVELIAVRNLPQGPGGR